MFRLLTAATGGGLAGWAGSIGTARQRGERLLAAQAAATRILTSSGSLADAAPALLQTVGETLGWRLGTLWIVRAGTDEMHCTAAWADPRAGAQEFLDRTRATVFHPGEGLPGRVWQSGRATWVTDVLQDENFPRVEAAARAGFRSAFCCPVRSSRDVLGVIEFFVDRQRPPDRPLLDLMDAFGGQLGEYVERTLAQESVRTSEARKAAVLEAALDCIVTMDGAGRVVEFNPAAEQTFGYSAEEAIGRELAELIVPPDLRDRHREGLARYLETGEGALLNRRVELRGMRSDGSEFPVELTINAIAANPPIFTGHLRDASERREAEAVQQRLAAIVESSEDAILSEDLARIITTWNSAAEELYGYTAEEAIGMRIDRLEPPHRAGEDAAILERLFHGERIDRYETERVRKDGTQVDVALSVSPLRDPSGDLVGASVIARDITQVKRAQRQATFLAEAQALLSSSLDYELTLSNLARLVVPHIADWCAIDMVGAAGALERLTLAHVDPAKERLAREIEERYPAEPSAERGALKAVLSGRSELIREIPAEMIEEAAEDHEHLRLIRELDLRSAMVVPLLARDRAIGAITLATAESGRLFGDDDLALAQDLAARAAIAVDNARLYGERSYIASTLQRALLPENLPDVPGVDLAARYCAAGEVNQVGGDFYDIYRSGQSTWGLAIGDVRGKGPRAAAVTALVRYTLRTASLSETVPSRVLSTLNEAMLRQHASDRFCTVAYASMHPSTGGRMTMTLGVGGHPLPLVLRSDGSVEPVGTPGTLIGLVADPEIIDVTFELGPSDALVLYTDGVPEARSASGLFGEERLVALLRGCAGATATDIAERIEEDVLGFQGGETSDDLAVLVMRVRDERELGSSAAQQAMEPAEGARA